MCTIMGASRASISEEEFGRLLDRTKTRGPDAVRIVSVDGVLLGFRRLSIMGLDESGMQPFELGGNYVVCNGEIYGFRAIKKQLSSEYDFKSGSDCEVLLPLYEKYGTDMFRMLDAEFALIIWDARRRSLVAARDPIGIRPLYYGYAKNGDIAFASEPKNLVGYCDRIMPFPPGHYYADGKFVCYRDVAAVKEVCYDDIDTACKNIHDKLIAGVVKRLDSDVPLGFLLSGGLDSSLVCAIARHELGKPIRTFSIGMSDDAIDLKYAREVAQFIESEHTEVLITRNDVIAAIEPVIEALASYDITTVRASIGMYLVCKYIHEHTDIRVLLTGEISDELFGYKYTDFAPSAEEFQREAQKRIREIHMYDVLRADRCIAVNSLEARVPFGDLEFAEYVMSLNPELKMNRYGKGKYLLRRAFAEDGILPERILWREKAAFSDAVGHSMVDYIKEYAAELYTEDELKKKCARYEHVPPYTPESLLYREIFEKYYPGQAHMIVDFWMPNRSWEGCNVDDPSARVLSNYGASGV